MKLRSRGWFGFAALMWAALLTAFPVHSHEIRPAIFTLSIKQDNTFTLNANLNIEALLANIGAEHEDTDQSPNAQTYNSLRKSAPGDLEARFRDFAVQWMSEIGLTFDGQQAALSVQKISISQVGDTDLPRISDVLMAGEMPSGSSRLKWAYPQQHGSSVLRIERLDEPLESQFYGAGAESQPIAIRLAEPRSSMAVFVDYVGIGFTHILPKGLDHILFVLGLFLLNQHWRPLLMQVTAFTLAHSVTLALGLYGLISVSPAIVEPLIALSIVYVAVENIFTSKLHVWRTVVVFLFGLLHGLGFAGILQEIGLAREDFVLGLVAFNIGVELGQLAVIAIAFAGVFLFLKQPWYRQRIVIPASVAIAAMGGYWVIERTLL